MTITKDEYIRRAALRWIVGPKLVKRGGITIVVGRSNDAPALWRAMEVKQIMDDGSVRWGGLKDSKVRREAINELEAEA